jgi:hypothetical protein
MQSTCALGKRRSHCRSPSLLVPTRGRGGRSLTGPRCHRPTGGRGGPSPPYRGPAIGPQCRGPTGGRSLVAPPPPSWSRR